MITHTPETRSSIIIGNTPAPEPGRPHPICRLIRQLREARGEALAQFAARTGFSAVVVGAYERGDRMPPVAKLDIVLRALGYELYARPRTETAVIPDADLAKLLMHAAHRLATGTAVDTPVNTPVNADVEA